LTGDDGESQRNGNGTRGPRRIRVETFPQVDIAALPALRGLLEATAICGVAIGLRVLRKLGS
jgi:hypothetical protein